MKHRLTDVIESSVKCYRVFLVLFKETTLRIALNWQNLLERHDPARPLSESATGRHREQLNVVTPP